MLFHLNAVDFNFGIFSDLSKITDCRPSETPNGIPNFPLLPLRLSEDTEKFTLALSQLSQEQREFAVPLKVSNDECSAVEARTRQQRKSQE